MSPHDPDGADGAETTDEGETTAMELNETETRAQVTHHLREALSATDRAAKQYHIRQALQLLDIEER